MFQRSAHDGLELVFVNIVGKLSGRIDFFHKRFLSEEVGFYRLMKNLEYVAVYESQAGGGLPTVYCFTQYYTFSLWVCKDFGM